MSSSLTVSIGGTNYQILSFSIKNRINERAQFDMVAIDTTNTAVFSKGEKIIVTDANLGTLFQGFINTAEPLQMIPQPYTYWQINCVDYHYVADKRTVVASYTNQYAGYIALDMLSSTLAAEGVSSQYAVQHTTTQSDFAAGTLSSTVATGNVGDGDLELVGSSSASGTFTTQAQWNTGTQSNTQANAGGDLSLIQITRNWNDGNKSGQSLYGEGSPSDSVSGGVYQLTCTSSAETRSRLDFAGTAASGTIVIDMNLDEDTSKHSITYLTTGWTTDDGTYAYAVELTTSQVELRRGGNGLGDTSSSLALSTFGTKLAHGWYTVKVSFGGGSHTVSVGGTQYLSASDSTYTAAGYIALRNRNKNSSGTETMQFDNFGVTTVTSGTWTSPSTSINAITVIASSVVSWDTSLSNGGTVTVQTSTNGGSTYSNATNGGQIPGLTKGSAGTGKNVVIKVTLSTTSPAQAPDIRNLQWSVLGGYSTPGTRSTVPLGNDTMIRANQSGWGTSFDGQTYTKVGTGTDAIASNAATLANTTGNCHEHLGSTTGTDEDGTVNFSLSASTINAAIELRFTDGNNFYQLVASTTALSIVKMLSGTQTTLATATVALSTGTAYVLRFRVTGNAPAMLFGRVWQKGTLEPTTWAVTVQDAGTSAIPLTLYGSNVASGTLSTAANLASGTGGTEAQSALNTPASNATGYMEISPLGGTQTINASLPATPSGKGWLWDVTTLEGQQLNTGNYQFNVGIADTHRSDSNVTLVWRAWKRSSGGSYTSIGSITLTSQTVNSTRTNFVFGPSSLASTSFGTGDKLYVELYAGNVSWQTGSFSQQYVIWLSTSSTAGVTNDAMATTPGYQSSSGSASITSGGFALMANGTGTTSFDHLRVTQYPDPSLSLASVQRAGSTFFTWDATLPTNTTLGMDLSGDGVTWTDMSAQNGGSIPFIKGQPDPTLDDFAVNTSANYLSTAALTSLSADTFMRANQSGWGTASDGEAWTQKVGAATLSIANNEGLVSGSATDNIMLLGAQSQGDMDGVVRMMSSDGADIGLGIILRSDSAAQNYYYARVSSGVLQIGKFVAGSATLLHSTTFAITSGTFYWLRFRVIGTSPAVLQARIWQDGTSEPSTWLLTGSDSDVPNPGTTGVRCHPSTSGSTGSFDHFTASALSGATWTWDTTNSRLIGTGGSDALLIFNTVRWVQGPVADIDLLCDLDQSDAGGLVWQYQDQSNFYLLVIADSASNVGTPNELNLYRVNANVTTLLATATVAFTRGTYHRFRVTMLIGIITIQMDGVQALVYTDNSPLGAGQVGLWQNGGAVGARYYTLWVQPQGDYVGGTPFGDVVSAQFVYSRQRLATTDNTVTPQLLDMTIGVTDPSIGLGTLIPTTNYASTFVSANMDDITNKSANYAWKIDQNTKLHFQTQQTTPAPWILDSQDSMVQKLRVIYDAPGYSNRQQLTNVISTIAFSDTKIGDSNSRSFALSYPNAAAPVIMLDGNPQSVGVKGVDANKNWYWQYGDPTIYQDANGTVMANTDTLSVTGMGLTTTTVTRDNLAAQAAMQAAEQSGTGIVEAVTNTTQFGMNVAAAQVYGDQLNARWATLGRTFKFETTRTGLAVGQLIPGFVASRISRNSLSITNAQLFITAVEIQARSYATAPSRSSRPAISRVFGSTLLPTIGSTPSPAGIRYVSIVEASETPYTGSWARKLAARKK